MAVYMILEIEVVDAETYAEYVQQALDLRRLVEELVVVGHLSVC